MAGDPGPKRDGCVVAEYAMLICFAVLSATQVLLLVMVVFGLL